MIYSKITGRRNPQVKVPVKMFSDKSHYHIRYGAFSTVEWEVHVVATVFREEFHYAAMVRNMSFCYRESYVGEKNVVDALNVMFKEKLGVTFI